MNGLKGKAIRGGLARICGQAIILALRLGFMAIMARLLNPTDFGLVAMTSVVTGIYGLFSTAGLSMATVQRPNVTNQQLSTLFWINVLVGLILCLLCIVTAPALVYFFDEPRLFSLGATIGLGFVFSAGGVQHSALLQRQLRYIALATTETLSLLGSFSLGIAMALGGFHYWALVGSAIAAPALNTALLWTIAAWTPSLPRRGAGIYEMLRFGGTITLNNLVIYLAYNLDKVLLGRVWGADALGLYGRAYQLINVPNSNLLSAVGTVLFSTLARLHDDPVRLRSYFLKGYSLVSSLTVPISIFGAVFADDIILVIFGPRWTEATAMFRLLTPTIFVYGVINPTGWLIQAVGLQGRSLRIAFVIAPLTITAYLLGLPYGPQGVALAFSSAMMLWLIPHVFWAVRGTVVRPYDIFIATFRPVVASVASALFSYLILSAMILLGYLHSPFFKLALASSVMAMSYGVLFLLVMGQKTFYLDLVRGLQRSASAEAPTETASGATS